MPQLPRTPSNWTVSTDWRHGRHRVEPGTELSIAGEPGRFRFLRHVATPTATWIDVVGGRPGREATRSFRPDRIRTVHRLTKTRPPPPGGGRSS